MSFVLDAQDKGKLLHKNIGIINIKKVGSKWQFPISNFQIGNSVYYNLSIIGLELFMLKGQDIAILIKLLLKHNAKEAIEFKSVAHELYISQSEVSKSIKRLQATKLLTRYSDVRPTYDIDVTE